MVRRYKAIDCWVNTNLGMPEGDVSYLFPDLAERWERGTTLSQLLDEMDASNIEKAVLMSGYGAGDTESWVKDAVVRHPARFAASHMVDPREGMKAVRLVEHLVKDHDYRLVRMMGLMTQKSYDDAIYYPIYAKCAELGVPVCLNVGLPGPQVPGRCQDPFALDEVCFFFPELKIIMAHGGEPWSEMCVKLMLKWPNLYAMTSAFAPKHIPEPIFRYLNSRGADKVMWASDYPVLTFERCMREIDQLEFRDEETRHKFQYGNASKLFFSH